MIMQRKVEGSRILTPGVNLGTLWAKTDTRACGAPRVFSSVLRCSYLTGIHQGSWSKLTLYQWCWWVPDCTEVMETKANTKLKEKQKPQKRVFFYFSQIFSMVEYICCISIENTTFWLVWKSVSGNNPKRTKHVSGNNGCY